MKKNLVKGPIRSKIHVGSKTLKRRYSKLPRIHPFRADWPLADAPSLSRMPVACSCRANALSVSGASAAPNAASTRCRMTSSGVSPSNWRAMNSSASRSRKNCPDTGSFTMENLPALVSWGRIVKSERSLKNLPAVVSGGLIAGPARGVRKAELICTWARTSQA